MRTKAKAKVVEFSRSPVHGDKTGLIVTYWKNNTTYSHTRRVYPGRSRLNQIRDTVHYDLGIKPVPFIGGSYIAVVYSPDNV